jgi:hypothetical protein
VPASRGTRLLLALMLCASAVSAVNGCASKQNKGVTKAPPETLVLREQWRPLDVGVATPEAAATARPSPSAAASPAISPKAVAMPSPKPKGLLGRTAGATAGAFAAAWHGIETVVTYPVRLVRRRPSAMPTPIALAKATASPKPTPVKPKGPLTRRLASSATGAVVGTGHVFVAAGSSIYEGAKDLPSATYSSGKWLGRESYAGGKWAAAAAWVWFWGPPEVRRGGAPKPTNTVIAAAQTPSPTPAPRRRFSLLEMAKEQEAERVAALKASAQRTPEAEASPGASAGASATAAAIPTATAISRASIPTPRPTPRVTQWAAKGYQWLEFGVFLPGWILDHTIGAFFSNLPF